MNENEYIENWIDTSITLKDWLQHENINHWELIDECELDEDKIHEIEQHQHRLFHECLNNIVNHNLQRLNDLQSENQKTTAKEHLRIINSFLESTEVKPLILGLLRHIISISETDYLPVLQNYQLVISQRYNDFRTDFAINQKDKFKISHYLTAYILHRYKKELERIITGKSIGVAKTTPTLSLNQIALKYVYESKQITRENGNEIARQYGHTSGEKLFQQYTYYSSAANRKGKPTPLTQKKLSNKIELIESVIAILPTDKKQRAVDELKILKSIFDTEYQ